MRSEEEILREIGKFIETKRKKRSMTLKEFEKITGVHYKTISRHEAEGMDSITTLLKYSRSREDLNNLLDKILI